MTLSAYADAALEEKAEAVARVRLEAPSSRCAHGCALSAQLAAEDDNECQEPDSGLSGEAGAITSAAGESWHEEALVRLVAVEGFEPPTRGL